MNFAGDVVDQLPPSRLALVELARDGTRREWSFGEVERAQRAHGRRARAAGDRPGRRGDDADRQPARVGLRDGRLLSDRRRRAARAPSSCARKTCACASTRCPPGADRRRRAQPRRAGGRAAGLRGGARARRAAVRARAGAARRAGRRGPLPDHLHERHGGRAEGGRPRPALPRRPAPAGRPLAGRAPGRARLVHGRQRLVEVGAQRVHRAVAVGRRRRCCTTLASIRRSAWSCWRASGSTCSAWRRPSTACSPSARRCGRLRTCAGWWPPARR